MYSSYISENIAAIYYFIIPGQTLWKLWKLMGSFGEKIIQDDNGKIITKINIYNIAIKDISIFKGKPVIFKEDILGKRILKMDLFLFWEWLIVFLSPPSTPLLLCSSHLTFHGGGWCDSSCSAKPLLAAIPIRNIDFFLSTTVSQSISDLERIPYFLYHRG